MRPENFFARVSDLHRGFGLARRHGRDDLQRNHFALAAEAAAHQRLDDANLRHRHLQHDGKLVLQVVRHLGGRPHRQPLAAPALRVEFKRRQRGVWLHGGVRDFVGDVARLRRQVGFSKTFIRIAKDVVIILLDVVLFVLVDEVALGLHGFFRVEISRQRLIFHVNQFHRLFGDALRNGAHAGHVVAHVADLIHRQRGLIVANRQNAVLVGGVLADYDAHHAFQR